MNRPLRNFICGSSAAFIAACGGGEQLPSVNDAAIEAMAKPVAAPTATNTPVATETPVVESTEVPDNDNYSGEFDFSSCDPSLRYGTYLSLPGSIENDGCAYVEYDMSKVCSDVEGWNGIEPPVNASEWPVTASCGVDLDGDGTTDRERVPVQLGL
jgi:hypothetical protein